MRVLIACEFSGIVRDAFKDAGHDAWSCDLLDTETPGKHIKGDVLDQLREGYDLMIAHPPCTYLTLAGNRWFKPEYKDRFPDRQQQRQDAIKFFMAFVNAPIEKICIENPIGHMSTAYRKADQIIQPYQFGHPDRKATCLWLKNLPPLKPTNIIEPEIVKTKGGNIMSRHHAESVSLEADERWKFRSRTYLGIAAAMAEQWGEDK